ncbi:MAG: UDP-3-O-(3-hydroxymyristoyl)glucosamine N-acyltransferase [Rhodobacteraceae bacterium]|nr:UDP-3-O-(3-hydroxymyristoyl)glucosamine N-acyltransferase [Paracoccaceae bacterium]
MSYTIQEIATALGAKSAGRVDLSVSRAAEPASAGPGDLALAMDPTYAEDLAKGSARVAVLWSGADWKALGLEAAIFVTRPRYALAGITAAFERPPEMPPGIHPTAVIDPSTSIAPDAHIGPFTVIGAHVVIGEKVRIEGQVTIAEHARIGDNALLHSGMRIGSRVVIGNNFIGHYNSVIGGDGFSFVTPEPGAVEEARREFRISGSARPQSYARISSNGSVRVGNDVELGVCSAIDKGTIADTFVGDGTKIDNHVQIGHNVRLGRDCMLCGHTAVAGSAVLGDRVVLGGKAGVIDHLVIGDDVIAAASTMILSNVPAGRLMMGYPAMPLERNVESYKAIRRLPRLVQKVADLQKQVSKLIENS